MTIGNHPCPVLAHVHHRAHVRLVHLWQEKNCRVGHVLGTYLFGSLGEECRKFMVLVVGTGLYEVKPRKVIEDD